jgi:hypothetical protein
MPNEDTSEPASRLDHMLREARDRVRLAEAALEQAMQGHVPVSIGDKRLVSEALEQAFSRLREAQVYLRDVQALMAAVA